MGTGGKRVELLSVVDSKLGESIDILALHRTIYTEESSTPSLERSS